MVTSHVPSSLWMGLPTSLAPRRNDCMPASIWSDSVTKSLTLVCDVMNSPLMRSASFRMPSTRAAR